MISQNPPLPIPDNPFNGIALSDWLSPSKPWEVPHDLLIETFSTAAPYAYFGTYTVELDKDNPHKGGTIFHNVFSDVMRAYTGTVEQRPFLFDGHDYLNVGVSGQYLRRLKRLT